MARIKPTFCLCKSHFLRRQPYLFIRFCIVYGSSSYNDRVAWLQPRPICPQSLKYLLSYPLQKFANPWCSQLPWSQIVCDWWAEGLVNPLLFWWTPNPLSIFPSTAILFTGSTSWRTDEFRWPLRAPHPKTHLPTHVQTRKALCSKFQAAVRMDMLGRHLKNRYLGFSLPFSPQWVSFSVLHKGNQNG